MLIVSSDTHKRHPGGDPGDPPVENAKRVEVITQALQEAGHTFITPQNYGLGPIERVHAKDYLDFLSTIYTDWQEEVDGLVPIISRPGRENFPECPDWIFDKVTWYSFDAGTLISEGTWAAAVEAAHIACTAVDKLADETALSTFAMCRPPGHHAPADMFGGFCYLNNAAIAAQKWLDDHDGSKVAILDVDFHHGNGTQSIFYERNDVLYLSTHCDPHAAYPFQTGFADETGTGAGKGFNLNIPLPAGTTWNQYEPILHKSLEAIAAYNPDLFIVSFGLDTFAEDPIANFAWQEDDYTMLGKSLFMLGLPTLFVLEGGYNLEHIGACVAKTFAGFGNLTA